MKKYSVSNDPVKGSGRIKDSLYDVETEYMTSLLAEGETDPLEEKEIIFEPGEILHGLYQVQRLLGEGGMGRVYLCLNLKLGNLWAVKHLKAYRGVKKIPGEENILKRLNHPYLPKIVDRFEDDTGIYIVESYVEGISLNKKLELEGPFTEKQVVSWSMQLTDALEYLHSIKPYPIIYQDMKPSNIIITPEDKAVMIDFGVSTEFAGKDRIRKSVVGITNAFAAPEQHRGRADPRSDIYSLGVMLYYLLTKKIPVQWQEVHGIISEEMEEILKKCIKEAPDERYQSIIELRGDLNQHFLMLQGVNPKEDPKKYHHPLRNFKRLILVMSPEAAGKTTVAVNLAYGFSQRYIRTALIDTDLKKKDIYYHFDQEYSECLSGINQENFLGRGKKINSYLKVYSEHRDVELKVDWEELLNLLSIAKNHSQMTIVDLGSDVPLQFLNKLILFADEVLLVVDQRVGFLNRLQEFLRGLDLQGKDINLVINRYVEGLPINLRQIKSICKRVITEEESYSISINQTFLLPDDYTSIVKALADRRPAIEIKDNLLMAAFDEIIQYYFPEEENQTEGLFKQITKLFGFSNKE
ncbi:protein kinase domain-containing protein [Alkaliphilus crotonatoxidans]